MFIRTFLAILFILTIACAPTKKEVQVSPQPPKKPKEVLMTLSDIVSTAELEKRIETLDLLLHNPDLSEQQKVEIRDVINTYTVIKNMSAKGYLNQTDLNVLIRLLFKSFQIVEGKYVSAIQKKPVNISKIMEDLAQKREKIIQDYTEGRHTDVVNQCLELKLKYGGYVMGADLETIFAISLAEIGMIREAIDTGEKALQEIAFIPKRSLLKKKIEEWKKSLEEAGVPLEEKKEEAISEKKEEKPDINLILINAKRLIEQENFEQALAILNESKIEDNEKIEKLKNKAIDGIINRERNKAARLFLRARESEDPEKKREYLETAFRILEALIVQYPSSPLMDRIKENLNKVSEELNSLPSPSTPVSQ